MINYNGRTFKTFTNSENGEAAEDTIFHYSQSGDIVTATYSSKNIKAGNLIAKVLADYSLEMLYQHINTKGEFRYGRCHSIPEVLPNGRLKLYENWQWLNGDMSKGTSILIEIAAD